jgi:hypothetical protein
MILLQIYLTIALVTSIVLMLIIRKQSTDFDKFIHDETNGMVEFTWWDKIIIPIYVGFVWPWSLFIAWGYARKW